MNTQGIGMLESERARFEAVVQKWYFDDEASPTPDMLKPLEDCTEPLPEKTCEFLDLPVGSTYGDAVNEFAPGGMYVLDLHGLSVRDAIEIAEETINTAHEAGFRFVKLIHGAPEIRHHMTAQVLRRGGIKWELRGCLSRGDWDSWVYSRRSAKHRIGDGAMILALRANARATSGSSKEVTG